MNIVLRILLLSFILSSIVSCIGDDFIEDGQDPEVRITTLLDSLESGTTFQYNAVYLNNVGIEEGLPVIWTSSDETIASISESGLVTGLGVGSVLISANVDTGDGIFTDAVLLTIGMTTVNNNSSREGVIATTTFYKLEGSFLLDEIDNGSIRLSIDENFCTTSALPGLYVYLSNNRNSIAEAFEIGEVTTFEGAHEFEIEDIGLMDYNFLVYFCKPFNVKVGDGEIN